MFGLTSLGVVHTAISLAAVIAGFYVLLRDKNISLRTGAGKFYFWTTVITCLTGFGIFQHGGFGKPHVLGIVTLVVLAVAWIARSPRVFGRVHEYVEAVCYTLTVAFHLIPAVTESATRLPLGAPMFTNPDDPAIQKAIAFILVAFTIVIFVQVWSLRQTRHTSASALPPQRQPVP